MSRRRVAGDGKAAVPTYTPWQNDATVRGREFSVDKEDGGSFVCYACGLKEQIVRACPRAKFAAPQGRRERRRNYFLCQSPKMSLDFVIAEKPHRP